MLLFFDGIISTRFLYFLPEKVHNCVVGQQTCTDRVFWKGCKSVCSVLQSGT